MKKILFILCCLLLLSSMLPAKTQYWYDNGAKRDIKQLHFSDKYNNWVYESVHGASKIIPSGKILVSFH